MGKNLDGVNGRIPIPDSRFSFFKNKFINFNKDIKLRGKNIAPDEYGRIIYKQGNKQYKIILSELK